MAAAACAGRLGSCHKLCRGEPEPRRRGPRPAQPLTGIREYAKRGGAALLSIREEEVEEWLASDNAKVSRQLPSARLVAQLEPTPQHGTGWPADMKACRSCATPRQPVLLPQPSGAKGGDSRNAAGGDSSSSSGEPAYSLFAFPAYDNFSGKIGPAQWVKAVQAKSTPGHQWKVGGGEGSVGQCAWQQAASKALTETWQSLLPRCGAGHLGHRGVCALPPHQPG